VHVFERDWLVNLILFGNYARLRDHAIQDLAANQANIHGNTLQIACVYGNLTQRLLERMAPNAHLDVIDILPIQLENLRRKLPSDSRAHLQLADSTQLQAGDGHYDQVLMFFLLHEQPAAVRRASLREAVRVLKPGGRLVIVDYHRPATLHPLRPLLKGIFHWLEPYAQDLWQQTVEDTLPTDIAWRCVEKKLFFGGVYQRLIITR
jgi:ubiquinone/menaquinone biosynthesis C-methylase UbiE